MRLFVYGIFLDEDTRQRYGMSNPRYDVVPNYLTFSMYGSIVQASAINPRCGVALTGLTVDVAPERWPDIDRLESAYDRITVTTISGERVFMYAAQEG